MTPQAATWNNLLSCTELRTMNNLGKNAKTIKNDGLFSEALELYLKVWPTSLRLGFFSWQVSGTSVPAHSWLDQFAGTGGISSRLVVPLWRNFLDGIVGEGERFL